MELIKVIITACGGAFVTGLFAFITSRSNKKKKKKSELNNLENKLDTVLDTVEVIDKKLNRHIYDNEECNAESARAHILQGGDEIRHGVEHSEEWWNELLRQIDIYEDFCKRYPDYPNTRATNTIAFIKHIHGEKLEKNDFLV